MLKVNGKVVQSFLIVLFVSLCGCSMVPKEDNLTEVAGVENMDAALKDLNDPEKQAAFTDAIRSVATSLSSDSSYKRIPLDTTELKDWFAARAFLLWDGKISKSQFVDMGSEKFPGYTESFRRVADKLIAG